MDNVGASGAMRTQGIPTYLCVGSCGEYTLGSIGNNETNISNNDQIETACIFVLIIRPHKKYMNIILFSATSRSMKRL